ncbi:serine kinase [Sporosarcina sp. P21c]|uniref:phosphotransferase enzyme family protein n=1 Tax=unclassified Sporosarcina TaxID=2647733 RepID=UPI000C16395D|nr:MULTISPECIES: phosphotransferase [unclassified Sporosarcina]PIC83115.1 serine kinase [Sporosarcina sp. P1]PIC90943.1 serine kinase [Sporosarcina sp. P21c]
MGNTSANTWDRSVEFFNQVSQKAKGMYEGLDDFSVRLLDYSENATYLVENTVTDEKYILRVCRPDYHKKVEIESEVKWLQSIDEHTTIMVSKPILGSNNDFLQTVTLEGDNREYHCVLFTFLEGETPDVDNEEKLIRIFREIGKTTAQFHQHSISNYAKFEEIKRPIWDYNNLLGEQPKWGRWQDGRGITPEREQLLTRVSKTIKSRLEDFGKGPEFFGLIHADLRHANLLIDNEKKIVQVIDFDDSGFGWYLYDLATSLSFIEHRSYVPKLIEAWLEGYREIRSLSAKEEKEIPTFIMMRRLQLIAWIGSRDNETAEELGAEYSVETDDLAVSYLKEFEYSE